MQETFSDLKYRSSMHDLALKIKKKSEVTLPDPIGGMRKTLIHLPAVWPISLPSFWFFEEKKLWLQRPCCESASPSVGWCRDKVPIEFVPRCRQMNSSYDRAQVTATYYWISHIITSCEMCHISAEYTLQRVVQYGVYITHNGSREIGFRLIDYSHNYGLSKRTLQIRQ